MTEPVSLPEPPHSADDLLPGRLRRFGWLVAAVAIGVALVGFLTGIREPRRTVRPAPVATRSVEGVLEAVPYAEISKAPIGVNAWRSPPLNEVSPPRPKLFDAVVRTEEMKARALADRARNRAYDGAPPSIPHPVEARTSASCLVCHGEGLKVGDRVASKISHAHHSNCTQCHVEQSPFASSEQAEIPASDFAGLMRSGPGERALAGAPPTIPHSTWMREDCTSCHGLVTRPGIRTTHPWLSNCTQCHAPSAALDQVFFMKGSR